MNKNALMGVPINTNAYALGTITNAQAIALRDLISRYDPLDIAYVRVVSSEAAFLPEGYVSFTMYYCDERPSLMGGIDPEGRIST